MLLDNISARDACLRFFHSPFKNYKKLSDAELAQQLILWFHDKGNYNMNFQLKSENTGLHNFTAVFSDDTNRVEYGAESDDPSEAILLAALRVNNIVVKPDQSWSFDKWEIA